jgi:divalent metal cation (Fe/Co/Zn/Cd) transporter
MKKLLIMFYSTTLVFAFSATQVFAASNKFKALVGRINEQVLNPLIVLLFTAALVFFVVGLFNFFGKRDNSEALEKGKAHMLWGIIGMAIMVSVFGIMNFLTSSLGINNVDPSSRGDVSTLFKTTQ